MSKAYKILNGGKSADLKPGFQFSNEGFNPESTARKALEKLDVPKEWAAKLDVSVQYVNGMLRGEPIPEARMYQIAEEAYMKFRGEYDPLRDSIELMMFLRYGHKE